MTILLPPVLPRWATGATADVTEPLSALKDTGWVGGATPDRPAAQHMNWLLQKSYEAHLWWMQFLIFRPSSDWVDAVNPFPGMDSDSVNVNQVAYSPTLDLYAAVGDALESATQKHLIATSQDLSAWTVRLNLAMTGVPSFVGVRWLPGPALFVAFGGNSGDGNRIYTSSDGITWTSRTVSGFTASSPIWDVNYDPINALWIAIDDTHIGTCPDIVTAGAWTIQKTVGGGQFRAIAVNDVAGITCVGNTSPVTVQRATDAITYSAISLEGSPAGLDDIVWDGVAGKFLVASHEVTTSFPTFNHSSTGDTSSWTNVPSSVLKLEENLSPYRIGLCPDYGHVLLGTYPSRVFATFPYQDMPFFERETPAGNGLWTGVGNCNYFRPFWAPRPAVKTSRYWLLGGNSVRASNIALAMSTTPVY